MPYFEFGLESGRTGSIRGGSSSVEMSTLFEVQLYLRSQQADIDLEKTVGKKGLLLPRVGHRPRPITPARSWAGIVAHFEQVQAEDSDMRASTYMMRIVRRLWSAPSAAITGSSST